MPRISVVIGTYNRAKSLRDTIHSHKDQTFEDFEIIVVNGPSTDGTLAVLTEFADAIRIFECPELNVSKARNIGVDNAAGDVIAIIDDDAVPHPTWLEELAAAYEAQPGTGGVGGLVHDRSGVRLQYKYSAVDRAGRATFDVEAPLDRLNVPGANPFLYLQGTNASFWKSDLVAIGGFNELMEVYFEETEVCLRMIDQGRSLVALDGAAVNHLSAAGTIRDDEGQVIDPFAPVKNLHVFAYQNGLEVYGEVGIREILRTEVEHQKDVARRLLEVGRFSRLQFDTFMVRLEEASVIGRRQGRLPRPRRTFGAHRPNGFHCFSHRRPPGGRKRYCFATLNHPGATGGGIDRFTAELAQGMAEAGHEIHVIAIQGDARSILFQNGIWVHEIPGHSPPLPELDHDPARDDLWRIANTYCEVVREGRRRPFDVVSTPIWLAQGLLVALDPRFVSVVSLHTTSRTLIDLFPDFEASPAARPRIELERLSIETHAHTHANSEASLLKVTEEYGAPNDAFVIYHGVADHYCSYPKRRSDDRRLRILVVGRLEFRKGCDILLDIMPALLRRFEQIEFILVGDSQKVAQLGDKTFPEVFSELYSSDATIVGRVSFAGLVTDDVLRQHYADADLFLYPGRYESFGLPIAEAMSFALPIVATKAGGIAEIVVHRSNGILVEIGDNEALADAVIELVQDADARRRFGQASRKRYLDHFSLERSVTQTAAAYAKIGASRKDLPSPERGEVQTNEFMVTRWARIIERLTNCRGHDSHRIARRMIGHLGPHRDYAADVRAIWGLSNREFLLGLFELFQSTPLGRRGLWSARWQMFRVGGRLPMVAAVANSPTSQRLGTPTDWLDQLTDLAEDLGTGRPLSGSETLTSTSVTELSGTTQRRWPLVREFARCHARAMRLFRRRHFR